MWQDVVAFAIVALTLGLVVNRRIRQMRSGADGAHCAKCAGAGGNANSPGGRPAGGRGGRPLIPASSLRAAPAGRGRKSLLRDGDRRAG